MALGWRKEYSRYRGFFLNVIDAYKSKRDLMMFFEILLSFSTIALFSVFAIKPTAITILDLVKEISAREETVAKMDAKLTNLKMAQQNYSKEAERIQLLDSAIPLRPAPETFVRQIQGVSASDAVNLKSASVDEVTLLGDAKAKIKKTEESLPTGAEGISIYLDFNSNFESLNTLLSDLEYLRRPIKIDSLKITKQKGEEFANDMLDLTLSGQAPFVREENGNQENVNQ
jgi:hypothetical protein